MTTGDKIRLLRRARGLTQGELADIVGVKTAAINKYETGMVENFKVSTLKGLCEALNTTPAYLCGWESDFAEKPPAEVSELVHVFEQLSIKNKTRLLAFAYQLEDESKEG